MSARTAYLTPVKNLGFGITIDFFKAQKLLKELTESWLPAPEKNDLDFGDYF